MTLVLAILSAMLSYALVPLVNLEAIPAWETRASEVTQRKVTQTFLDRLF